ncbi:MAG: hypothetical protein FWE06_01455 [Oscillospiraceae bacterium]|nr:hypothetical protein [Oscillospiraceae bacterium]
MSNNGIWIGENATVVIVDEFRIAFLRIEENLIASILHNNVHGTVGVVYGLGKNFDAHSVVAAINPDSKELFASSANAKDYIPNHSNDRVEGVGGKLTYTTFDGKEFELVLAEKINMADFEKINEVDNSLSIAKKMALWNVNKYFEFADGYYNVGIDTEKYSILFSFSLPDESWVYCRVGQNGYCEKGRAMLSTICIRQNEVRMIENNLQSINEYRPIEDCFAIDGCAFPPDGGWYWSVKEVTNDVIYLCGCGDQVYEIHRK